MEPGDGGDRHAGLHGLLDQPDLFLGSVAPAALDAGDDFDARDDALDTSPLAFGTAFRAVMNCSV